jgi:hypothetical protein
MNGSNFPTMDEELSINPEKNRIPFDDDTNARRAALVRSAVGAVPHVGSVLTEIVNVVIPDNRVERLMTFAIVLDQKVSHLDREILELKMKTDKFTDLFEDSLHQAARATSDERREYIANLLKNSLTSNDLEHVEEKKLLSLLGELNDPEVLFLKYQSLHGNEKQDFQLAHSAVLMPIRATFGTGQKTIDKEALQESYRAKLMEVGLLSPDYKAPRRGELPEFDTKTGRIKFSGYKVTKLGRLLLRYISEDGHPEPPPRTDPI